MDWLSLAAVVLPSVVALAAIFDNVLKRRSDHKHTSALELNKRVWETKSAALLNLIGVCQSVLDAIAADPNRERSYTQYAVHQVFDGADYRIETPELIAYASQRVRGEVSELQKVMSGVKRKRGEMELVTDSYHVTPAYLGLDEDDPVFEHHPEVLRSEKEVTGRVGELTGINPDEVRKLCTSIIKYARADLHGT